MCSTDYVLALQDSSAYKHSGSSDTRPSVCSFNPVERLSRDHTMISGLHRQLSKQRIFNLLPMILTQSGTIRKQ